MEDSILKMRIFFPNNLSLIKQLDLVNPKSILSKKIINYKFTIHVFKF